MSGQFLIMLQDLQNRMESALGIIAALTAKLDAAVKRIDEIDSERRELRKEVRGMSAKVETLNALKDAIGRDAREILGAKRDLIDPTQVKMPQVLKTLGYGKENGT